MFYKFLLIAVLTCSISVAHAQLYKWVDKDGVTHYSEAPPPESAVHDREVLGSQGQSKGVIRGRISEEEREAEAKKQAEEEAKKKAEDEAKKRDRILLISYKSVEEIELKRNARLEYLDHHIIKLEETRTEAKAEYDKLLQEAILAERQGKPPSEDMKANLRSAQREYKGSIDELKQARTDRAKTIETYEADIVRFKELKSIN